MYIVYKKNYKLNTQLPLTSMSLLGTPHPVARRNNMPLVPNLLETQLNALSKQELSPEEANAKFAQILTDYIKMAQITVNVTGVGNTGAPVQSTGTGIIS